MHQRRIRRPSPALVISLVALFVALGGTGYAAVKINGKNIKNGTVTGAKLKKDTLTGTQINESKLGTVPSAANAANAANAADAADAAHAADADRVGGTAASDLAKKTDVTGAVGAALTPVAIQTATLQNNWVAFGGGFASASYYKDQLGVVHVFGAVKNGDVGSTKPILTLPQALRPTTTKEQIVNCANHFSVVDINTDGTIVVTDNGCQTYLVLDGVSFRADS